MAKKKPPGTTYTGGANNRKRRGLVSIQTAVTPEVRAACHRAAAAQEPPQRLSTWVARILEEAVRLAAEGKTENP